MASAESAQRRPGRPARIDRGAIAEAVAEVPLDDVSMRSVAERLGVSVPALYYYVGGRDDLLTLAAERSASRIAIPADRGQHWAVWLFEWADYARRAFASEPELLKHYVDGRLGLDRMVAHIDSALELLVRSGFSEQEALDAYYLVTQFALGAAVTEIRERQGQNYQQVLAEHSDGELVHLRRLVASGVSMVRPFRDEVLTVLAGIAVRRGENWRDLVGIISS